MEDQGNNFLPLNGKLTVPKEIVSGEEITKEQLEAKLFGGTTIVDLPDQNDMVPLMTLDESGNKSIPRAISVDHFAQTLADKMDIPNPGVDFNTLDSVSEVTDGDYFLVGPASMIQEDTVSNNKKITTSDLATGLKSYMDTPKEVLSKGIQDAQNAVYLTNETMIPVKKQGSSVEKTSLNDLTVFLQAAPVCKRFFFFNTNTMSMLTEPSVAMTRLDYSENMDGKYPHTLIICAVKFKAQNGNTYYDIVSSDIIPTYGAQTFYHTKASFQFGYIDLYFEIHDDYLKYRIISMQIDTTKVEFYGIYVKEVWGINFGNRDTSSGGGSSLHLGELTPITNFAKEDMFLVEDTLGDQYSITGEALANRLKSFMNLDMSHGTVGFFSVNNLNNLHAPEPYPISKNALIGAKPSIGEDLSYPCIFEVAEEDGDILKLHYGMFKIKEETETEYKIKVSNYSDILLYEDVSRGSMLLTILDTLPKKDEEKNFTDYAFTGRWPEVDHTTRQGFIIVNWKLYMVEYSVVFVGGMNIQIKFVKDPVLVSGGFPDIYTTEDIQDAESIALEDKMLLGTADGNKKIDQNMLIEFLKGQNLIDLDGKGRPLLPGYGIVTREVTIDINNTTYCDLGITLEDLGIESESDIVELLFYLDVEKYSNYSFIFVPYILHNNKHLAITTQYAEVVTLNNAKGRVGAIYKQKVPYEPGLKSISLTKTVSTDSFGGAEFATLNEFGITDISKVISIDAISANKMYVYATYREDINKIGIVSTIGNQSSLKVTVTLLVKDYSSIGPAIVTDGIRMITKEISGINFESNWMSKTLTNISNFDGVELSNILGVDVYVDGLDDAYIPGIIGNGDIRIACFNGGSPYSNLKAKVSLFVKVPVVEQKLKPFTKDVEVNLIGINTVGTGVILNGSDEVGGYTMENMTSYTVSVLTPLKYIYPPSINSSNEITVSGGINNTAGQGLCKLRIHIE